MQDSHVHPQSGYEYRTPQEYCDAAKISRATFWRWVKQRQISVVKFGDRCTRVAIRKEAKAEAA